MKLSNTAKVMTIVAVFALALTAAPAAKAADLRCSNDTLRGAYSDQDTGTIFGTGPGTGPLVGVNVDTFDGRGNITISGWGSVGGSGGSFSVATGTYQVNPDCTGTYTVTGGIEAFFVIDEAGNELKIVIQNPGTAINCVARKQFPEHHDERQ